MKKQIITFGLLCATSVAANAEIASGAYVREQVDTRVSVAVDANQDMQGTYNVSGTLTVPTQPLPESEIVQ